MPLDLVFYCEIPVSLVLEVFSFGRYIEVSEMRHCIVCCNIFFFANLLLNIRDDGRDEPYKKRRSSRECLQFFPAILIPSPFAAKAQAPGAGQFHGPLLARDLAPRAAPHGPADCTPT